jgi:probable phosphoglycerate mutase
MALGALVVATLVATATHAQVPAAATKPAPMRVLLIRHASSWKNVPSAQRPHPMSAAELDSLTPQGRARAEAIGRLLVGKGVVAVHASPAQRAQQTAAAIAAALGLGEPITNQAFRPLDTGSNATAARGTTRMKNWKGGRDPRPPSGESLGDGQTRASNALAELAKQHAGETIVVVTHGEIASSLITQAAGQDLLTHYFKNFPDEGSIHQLQIDETGDLGMFLPR